MPAPARRGCGRGAGSPARPSALHLLGVRSTGGLPVLQSLLGQHLLAVAPQLLDRGRGIVLGERAVVALVDRGHRGDVAGAQALKSPDEDLAVLGGSLAVDARGLAE